MDEKKKPVVPVMKNVRTIAVKRPVELLVLNVRIHQRPENAQKMEIGVRSVVQATRVAKAVHARKPVELLVLNVRIHRRQENAKRMEVGVKFVVQATKVVCKVSVKRNPSAQPQEKRNASVTPKLESVKRMENGKKFLVLKERNAQTTNVSSLVVKRIKIAQTGKSAKAELAHIKKPCVERAKFQPLKGSVKMQETKTSEARTPSFIFLLRTPLSPAQLTRDIHTTPVILQLQPEPR
jgi:uncharacterized protein YqgV (UPF0045/DUF77 family)